MVLVVNPSTTFGTYADQYDAQQDYNRFMRELRDAKARGIIRKLRPVHLIKTIYEQNRGTVRRSVPLPDSDVLMTNPRYGPDAPHNRERVIPPDDVFQNVPDPTPPAPEPSLPRVPVNPGALKRLRDINDFNDDPYDIVNPNFDDDDYISTLFPAPRLKIRKPALLEPAQLPAASSGLLTGDEGAVDMSLDEYLTRVNPPPTIPAPIFTPPPPPPVFNPSPPSPRYNLRYDNEPLSIQISYLPTQIVTSE